LVPPISITSTFIIEVPRRIGEDIHPVLFALLL
jgi:hypothetical protein